jgi:hypothetical protein
VEFEQGRIEYRLIESLCWLVSVVVLVLFATLGDKK